MCRNTQMCNGEGLIFISCCGDNMSHQLPENDLCPTCHEHCGDEDFVKCEFIEHCKKINNENK